MDKDFVKKWIEALRSGKYEQGKGKLFKDNFYCCLGVAGICAQIPLSEMYDKDSFFYPKFKKYPDLPKELSESVLGNKLAIMNDCDEMSFNEIANYLEENLK